MSSGPHRLFLAMAVRTISRHYPRQQLDVAVAVRADVGQRMAPHRTDSLNCLQNLWNAEVNGAIRLGGNIDGTPSALDSASFSTGVSSNAMFSTAMGFSRRGKLLVAVSRTA